MAVRVVALALFRVAQHLVRFTSLLELGGVAAGVGVVLLGELAVRLFDLRGAGAPRHAEHFVIISFGFRREAAMVRRGRAARRPLGEMVQRRARRRRAADDAVPRPEQRPESAARQHRSSAVLRVLLCEPRCRRR